MVSAKDKEVAVPPAETLLPDLAHQEVAVAGLIYLWQPKPPTRAKGVSTSAVHTLVRRLMAAERARLLGRRALDPDQYPVRNKAQRWREVRQPFK